MLQGTVGWPEASAAWYRREGHWNGTRLFEVLSRAALAHPDKTALVCDDLRFGYAELERDAPSAAEEKAHGVHGDPAARPQLQARVAGAAGCAERLEIVAEFPISPVGRILKRQLRDQVANTLQQESGA